MVTYEEGQFAHDPEKAKSRNFVRQKIEATFPNADARRELKVVFLTGPSLVEYEQIYKQLGVLPQNCYGIEMDNDMYRAVAAANASLPGEQRINLHNGDIVSFLKQTAVPFDVVNLDFDRTYGPDVIRSIDALFREEPPLSDDAIFAINVLGKRENPRYQARLGALAWLGLSMIEADNALGTDFMNFYANLKGKLYGLEENKLPSAFLEGADSSANKMLARFIQDALSRSTGLRLNETNYLAALRHGIYSDIAIRAKFPLLMTLKSNELLETIANLTKSDKRDSVNFEEYIRRISGEGLCGRDSVPLVFIGATGTEMLKDLFKTAGYRHFGPTMQKMFKGRFFKTKSMVPGSEFFLMNFYLANRMEARAVTEHENFHYVGEKRAPMIMNLFRLEKVDRSNDPNQKRVIATFQNATDINTFFYHLDKRTTQPYAVFDEFLKKRFGGAYTRTQFLELANKHPDCLNGFRAGQEFLNMRRLLQRGTLDLSEMIEEETRKVLKLIDFNAKEMDTFDRFRDNLISAANFDYLAQQAAIARAKPAQLPALTSPLQASPMQAPTSTDVVNHEKAITLSNEDKETIRELYAEGFSPKHIYDTLFAGTTVTLPQISAICAWKTIKEKNRRGA